MIKIRNPFALTATVMLFSAAIHIAVIIVTMGGYLVPMVIGAVLLSLMGLGINRTGSRWLAGLTFFVTAFLTAFTLGFALNATDLTEILLLTIIGADSLAVVLLFIILWRRAKKVSA